jgi:3-oxoacyl-[acyl-carrier-protein] synthase-3
MPRNVSITGTGAYHPTRILSNADLEKMVDTSDEWIVTRTGILERRIAAEDETTSDMAAKAARVALERAGVKCESVDLIIVATCTPDFSFPSTACLVQHKIGATRAAAFDLVAACSGFLYALITAQQFVSSGVHETVLVIGAEKMSSILNWKDRNTCVLFGDGAGAVVVQSRPGNGGIKASELGSDGSQSQLLSVQHSGCAVPLVAEAQPYIKMAGKEVYRHAVTRMGASAEKVLALAGWTKNDLSLVVPHQANVRIIEALAHRLEISMDKVVVNLDRYGNTSAACIPVALDEAFQNERLKPGSKVLLVAFGGGFTWASVALEW